MSNAPVQEVVITGRVINGPVILSAPVQVSNAVKGDIAVGTGGGNFAPLNVGSDTAVLTADSTQPSGVKWAAVPAAPVASVFGRTGAVTAQTGDYTAAQVSAQPAVELVNTVASAGASQTIPDVASATISDLTLTSAACTLTFPTTTAGKSFTLVLRQDATGGRTVTWPAGIKWPSGSAFVPTPAPSAVDVLSFLSVVANVWFGFPSGQDMR